MVQNPLNHNKQNSFLTGKTILLTQYAIYNIAGSEIVILELAKYLMSLGAHVGVYTWCADSPMINFFHEANIKIVSEGDYEFFDHCDYIWVHHQVLPDYIITQLAKGKYNSRAKFLFFHMSGLEGHLLEQPYIYGLERAIASRILYVSKEAQETITKCCFITPVEQEECLYPNPAPVEFAAIKPRRSRLRRILVVSNHPPQEILALRGKLGNLEISYLGEDNDRYTLLTPETLAQYDLVITIGKTVQYCLVAGIPVYVYDHFGGPGYLNDKNFDASAAVNFSGRRSSRKSTTEIVQQILSGYKNAARWQRRHRSALIERFSMPSCVATALGGLPSRPTCTLTPEHWRYISTATTMMKWKFRAEMKNAQAEKQAKR